MACKFTINDPTTGDPIEFESMEVLKAYVKDNLSDFNVSNDIPGTLYEEQRNKFVNRWNLKSIIKQGEFGYVTKDGKATLALARKMATQLKEKSGYLYSKLNLRYNSTYGLIQISAVDLEDSINTEESYDIPSDQSRKFDPLPDDFKRVPTAEKSAYVLSPEKRWGNNTFVKNGELFNVERMRQGKATDIAKTQKTTTAALKNLTKFSNLSQDALDNFFKAGSTKTFWLYKISKSTGPDDLIDPDQDTEVVKFIKSKQLQIKELQNRVRQTQDAATRTELFKEINRLEAQRKAALKPANQNAAFIKKSYQDDKELFDKKSLTKPRDIEFEQRRFAGYKILFDSMDKAAFGPEIEEEFKQIYKDLNDLQSSLKDLYLQAAASEMELGGNFNLRDDNGNLLPIKDISLLQEWLLSTSETTNNPLIRYITQRAFTELSRAKDKVATKGKVIKKSTEDLIKYSKDLSLKGAAIYNYMLEEDEKGKPNGHFVVHYGKFYSELSSIMRKGKGELSDVDDFLKYVVDNTSAINVEKEKYQAAFDKIYNRELEKASKIHENPADAEQVATVAASGISYGLNPDNFMKIVERYKKQGKIEESDQKFVKGFIDTGSWYNYIKLQPSEKHIDKKYEAIQKLPDTHPQKVFYNLFSEFHYEVGSRVRVDGFATQRKNFIAEFKRDYKEDDESMFDYLKKNLHDTVLDIFTESQNENIQGVDPITKEIVRMIPFYSMDGNIPADRKNYNLGKVMMNLSKEFYKFESLSDLEDDLLLAQHVIKNTQTFKVNSRGKVIDGPDGSPLLNDDTSSISKQLDYKVISTLYGQRMKKEGAGDTKYNDYETKQRLEELDKIKEEKGELDAEQAKEYRDLKARGTVITGKKATNALINFTSVRNIAFNLFSGTGEFMQANASLYLRYGLVDGGAALKSALSLLNPTDSDAKSKLKGLRDTFQVVGDTNSEMNESTFKKVAYAGFAPARQIGNTAYLVAVLKQQKLKDKEGNEHALFDIMSYDDNGKIVLPDNFVNPFYDEKGEYTQYKYNLQQIVTKEIRDNRDRENDIDPIAAHQYAAGRLVNQFKGSWLYQGFNTRFGAEKEGVNDLDQKSKGIYRGLWDLSKSYTTKEDALGNQTQEFSMPKTVLNVLVNLLKYSKLGRITKYGKLKEGQSTLDYEGAIRAVREVQTALFLYGMVMLLGMGKGGDDGDEMRKRIRTTMLNIFMRNQRDMSTYFDPNSLTSIVNKGIIPSLSTASDMWKIIMDIPHGIFSDKWYYNEGTQNESLRIGRDTGDMIPLFNQFRRTWNKAEKNQSIFYNSQF